MNALICTLGFVLIGTLYSNPITGIGSEDGCVTSCDHIVHGFYHSCTTCKNFVACTGKGMYVMNCPADLQWDDHLKRCEWKSSTCGLVFLPSGDSHDTMVTADGATHDAPEEFFDRQLMLEHPELVLKNASEENFQNEKGDDKIFADVEKDIDDLFKKSDHGNIDDLFKNLDHGETQPGEKNESDGKEEESDESNGEVKETEENGEEKKPDDGESKDETENEKNESESETEIETNTVAPPVAATVDPQFAHLPFAVKVEKPIEAAFIAAPGICSVKNGGDIVTFDSFTYKFEGGCKYVVSRDCDGTELLVEAGFKVKQSSPGGAVVDYVDIHVDDVWVRLHSMVMSFINGFAVPYSKTGSLDGVIAQTNAHNASMVTESGIEATLDQHGSFYLHLPDSFDDKVCGLCGNKDGDSTDDDALTAADDFAESYKSVSQDDFKCL